MQVGKLSQSASQYCVCYKDDYKDIHNGNGVASINNFVMCNSCY